MCERPVTIMAFNANGIEGQINELELLLHERNIDILLLNETHLKPKNKFRLQNYFIYINDRINGPMGGTAICVKKEIGHRIASIPNLHFVEITGIYLPIAHNTEIFIGSIYKPPSKLLTSHDLNIITTLSDRYLLAGDFNAKHKSWNCVVANPAGSKLLSYCRVHNIEITAPTDHTFYRSTAAGRTSDILDIVISKNVNISSHVTVLDEVLDSDHLPIEFKIFFKIHTYASI